MNEDVKDISTIMYTYINCKYMLVRERECCKNSDN